MSLGQMAADRKMYLYLPVILVMAALVSQSRALTDPLDVMALQDLYLALNSPPQLSGWRAYGGDPCQESWTGIICSGSSVTHIKLEGLNLTGYLGGQLHYLRNLDYLEITSNHIFGQIPYGLPPNATHINLAYNNLSQAIPHSLASCTALRHLNLSHNFLSGPIGNVFESLFHLKEMDLSYNNISGDLPSSFGMLTNLSRLFLQNNSFTGSVVYLADLPLVDLNIQANHFSGVIPTQFQSIPHLWIDGNTFHEGENYPPWRFPLDSVSIDQNFSGPPKSESSALGNYPALKVSGRKKKRMGPKSIAFTVVGLALLVTGAAIFIASRKRRALASPVRASRGMSFLPSEGSPQLLPIQSPPYPAAPRNVTSACPIRSEKTSARKSFGMKYKARSPTTAKIYTVAELQTATNSFSEENLLGEGSLGSVYRAQFPEGQVMAVKNVSLVSLSFQEEDQFLDVIWTASRLRHPNIVTLVGYCIENGQHLLVYEFVRSLSLHDVLHSKTFKPLSWTIRLTIALGIARALDYMHSSSMAHGNLKSSNILLDEELAPRLCDCGLAVLRPLAINRVKQKASEIALGDADYIDPENGEPGNDSTRGDVYSFGVLLLELLTGRKPSDSSRSRGEQSLVKWASSRLHDRECLQQMVDPAISRTLAPRSLSRFADIVSLCIQTEKIFRPAISEIAESLASLLQKFTAARSGAVEPAEDDHLARSFRSTQSHFISSPTVSFISV